MLYEMRERFYEMKEDVRRSLILILLGYDGAAITDEAPKQNIERK